MITAKRMVVGTKLTTSWVSGYNVPSSVVSSTVKQLVVCNTDTVYRTFYYAVTPSITAPADNYSQYIMFAKVTLQANETKVFGLTDIMPTGSYIYFKSGEADTSGGVNITVSGMETT